MNSPSTVQLHSWPPNALVQSKKGDVNIGLISSEVAASVWLPLGDPGLHHRASAGLCRLEIHLESKEEIPLFASISWDEERHKRGMRLRKTWSNQPEENSPWYATFPCTDSGQPKGPCWRQPRCRCRRNTSGLTRRTGWTRGRGIGCPPRVGSPAGHSESARCERLTPKPGSRREATILWSSQGWRRSGSAFLLRVKGFYEFKRTGFAFYIGFAWDLWFVWIWSD